MKKTLVYLLLFISRFVCAQTANIENSLNALQKDDQFKHAIISFYAIDAASGEMITGFNHNYGLAPASCQKIITSISAFEMLGSNYRFVTKFGYRDQSFYIRGGGDPTLGSSRWNVTNANSILNKIQSISKKLSGDQSIRSVYIDDSGFGYQPVPDGWIWQDIGNYYGAGAWSLNWKENMYEARLRSGPSLDSSVEIVSTEPELYKQNIISFIRSASPKSGDNAWLYAAPFNEKIFATGTIPVSQNNFVIKGAMPYPSKAFAKEIQQKLHADTIILSVENLQQRKAQAQFPFMKDSILSPSLDSINFWFLKKSVNLFGEAFVKAMGSKRGDPFTTSGIEAMRNFWKDKMDVSAMNIIDGSGLSPANRVTTKLLVEFLQYARNKTWFPSFYAALPEMNGIKMKDGYISSVRSYTGIVKQKNGKEVIFAFIVNNFGGSASAVREKMWRILDLLK